MHWVVHAEPLVIGVRIDDILKGRQLRRKAYRRIAHGGPDIIEVECLRNAGYVARNMRRRAYIVSVTAGVIVSPGNGACSQEDVRAREVRRDDVQQVQPST